MEHDEALAINWNGVGNDVKRDGVKKYNIDVGVMICDRSWI